MAEVNGATTTNNTPIIDNVGLASGLTFDFEDDITTIMTAPTATDANGINVSGSQHGALIVYGMSPVAVQKGLLYDHDGDGQLSDGDTVVDLTDAMLNQNDVQGVFFSGVANSPAAVASYQIIGADADTVGLMTSGLDYFEFTLSDGNLVA